VPARVTQAAIAELLFCVRDKFITFGFFRNKTRGFDLDGGGCGEVSGRKVTRAFVFTQRSHI
jgi:hypothetical protein